MGAPAVRVERAEPLASPVRVTVRFRPAVSLEEQETSLAFTVDTNSRGGVLSMDMQHHFQFDRAFDEHATQEDVYDDIGRPTVDDVLEGYHGTILAYGQTGSGKTYCMFGPQGPHPPELMGVVQRATRQMFDYISNRGNDGAELSVECSFFEVYCEQVRDLLRIKAQNLQLKEIPQKGFCVEGLSHKNVSSANEVLQALRTGLRARAAANTKLNQYSSRSHAVFVLSVNERTSNGSNKHRKLTLVDLAGSEKVHKSGSAGENLEEAKKINSSLSALGHVIDALAERRPHVPYRDSRLTRLLEDSLGGNCRTTLLVACAPSSAHSAETLSSLRFAARAKKVCNNARVNISSGAAGADKQHLQQYIAHLRRELACAHRELERRVSHLPASESHSVPVPPRSPYMKPRTLLRSWTEDRFVDHESALPNRSNSQPKLAKSASLSSFSSPALDQGEQMPVAAGASREDHSGREPKATAVVVEAVAAMAAAAAAAAVAAEHETEDGDNEQDFLDRATRSPRLGSAISTATGSAVSSSGSAKCWSLGSASATPRSPWRDTAREESPGRKYSWLIEATPLTDSALPPPRCRSKGASVRSVVLTGEEGHRDVHESKVFAGTVEGLQRQLHLEKHRCAALTLELERRAHQSTFLQWQLDEVQAHLPSAIARSNVASAGRLPVPVLPGSDQPAAGVTHGSPILMQQKLLHHAVPVTQNRQTVGATGGTAANRTPSSSPLRPHLRNLLQIPSCPSAGRAGRPPGHCAAAIRPRSQPGVRLQIPGSGGGSSGALTARSSVTAPQGPALTARSTISAPQGPPTGLHGRPVAAPAQVPATPFPTSSPTIASIAGRPVTFANEGSTARSTRCPEASVAVVRPDAQLWSSAVLL